MDRYGLGIGNHAAIATFGNSKTVNRCAGSARDFLIQIRGGGIGSQYDFLREFCGRFACSYVLLGRIGLQGSRNACLPLGRTERVRGLVAIAVD